MIHPSHIIIAGLFVLTAVPSLALFFKVIRKEQILKRPRVTSQPVEPPPPLPAWVVEPPSPLGFPMGLGFLDIVPGDLTRAQADVIVNAGNPQMKISVGVFGAIHGRAGAGLRDACLKAVERNGPVAPGKAIVTPAFRLKAKHVVHVVTPVWQDGQHGEVELLQKGYEECFRLAHEHGAQSVAFPALGCGIHRFPLSLAVPAALSAMAKALREGKVRDASVWLPMAVDWQYWFSWARELFSAPPFSRDMEGAGLNPLKEDHP